jgi:hypothetical protein
MPVYQYAREATCPCGKAFIKHSPNQKKCDECRSAKPKVIALIRKREPELTLTPEQRNYADFIKRLKRT